MPSKRKTFGTGKQDQRGRKKRQKSDDEESQTSTPIASPVSSSVISSQSSEQQMPVERQPRNVTVAVTNSPPIVTLDEEKPQENELDLQLNLMKSLMRIRDKTVIDKFVQYVKFCNSKEEKRLVEIKELREELKASRDDVKQRDEEIGKLQAKINKLVTKFDPNNLLIKIEK